MDPARAAGAASSELLCGRHQIRHCSRGSGRDMGRWVCAPAPQIPGALSWKQGLPACRAGGGRGPEQHRSAALHEPTQRPEESGCWG